MECKFMPNLDQKVVHDGIALQESSFASWTRATRPFQRNISIVAVICSAALEYKKACFLPIFLKVLSTTIVPTMHHVCSRTTRTRKQIEVQSTETRKQWAFYTETFQF